MAKYQSRKSYRTVKKKSPYRIIKTRMFWLIVSALILIAGTIYFFFFSDFFKMKDISVNGGFEREIEELVSARLGNIFLTQFDKLNEEVKNRYPQIERVNIEKKLPDKITVSVARREAVILFCAVPDPRTEKKKCFNLDKSGVVFEFEQETGQEMSEIVGLGQKNVVLGRQIIDPDYLQKILQISLSLKELGRHQIYPESETRLDLITEEGWAVYFDPSQNIDDQLENLAILLKERLTEDQRGNLEYVDLRFNKIYIKRSD